LINRGYQVGDGDFHNRTVDAQPMADIKEQTDYNTPDFFDTATSGSKTKVEWNDPICETCYLKYGSTVPMGTHQYALNKYYQDLGEERHPFKPLLPDVDERGNLKQGAVKYWWIFDE
jgi:hypothetical protein